MYEFLSYVASDFMTKDPVTIAPSATLAEARQVFALRSFNGLPVVDDDGRFVGFLTKLDWLKAFTFSSEHIVPHYNDIMQLPVCRFMTCDVVAVDVATPLTRVLQRMVDTRYKSVPVLQGHRVVGMISREDIVRALQCAAAAGAGESPSRRDAFPRTRPWLS